MKFVDEAKVYVEAGTGGNGACSFLRLKFVPFGGPDGGDGGDGGNVYLSADESINTLVDYRYIHTYKADNGEKGGGTNCTGRSGGDLVLRVPVGTIHAAFELCVTNTVTAAFSNQSTIASLHQVSN